MRRGRARVPTLFALLLALLAAGLIAGCPKPALAAIGTTDYPTSIAGCTPPSGGAAYNCDLKDDTKDADADPWDFLNRECTSFVAWRLNTDNAVAFSNNMTGPNGKVGHFGNASNWASNAQSIGYTVDSSPAAGAVAVWPSATNHVGYVAAVNSDGTINTEEYNWFTSQYPSGDGMYHTRTNFNWSAAGVQFIHIGTPPTGSNNPSGSFESVQPATGGVSVIGWTTDPNTSGSISVQVSIDGNVAGTLTANLFRSDVGYHGFSGTINWPYGGAHNACVTAFNYGAGSNTLLGCKTVLQDYDYRQQGTAVQGDFNGDGKADVAVFYNYPGNKTDIWLFAGDGAGGLAAPVVAWDSGPGNWTWSNTKPVVGDFNGDGKADVAVFYNYGASQTKLWLFTSAGWTFGNPAMLWDSGPGNWNWDNTKPLAGDFNGDGKADVAAFYDYGNSQTKLWLFAGNGASGFSAPAVAWDSGVGNWVWARTLPFVADHNSDGKIDIGAFYNYDNGQTKLWLFTSAGSTFGNPTMLWDSGVGNWEWADTLVS